MELRHLRYFSVLAQELHFGRAAQRLSITQPPLSSTLRSLEDELGTRLFERNSKQVTLTPAGTAFLNEVGPMLDQVRLACDVARAVGAGQRGHLEIGFTGSMIYRGVPQIATAFSQQHPGIEASLREMSSAEQINALKRGQIHAAFINTHEVPQGLAGHALAEDPFVCCLPENHPLAHRKVVDLKRLANEPFVMFTREVAPANYDNVIAICANAGFHPQTRFAVRQWLTVAALVANGLGVSLVPASIARSKIAGARFVPIGDKAARASAYYLWNPKRMVPGLALFTQTVHVALTAKPTRSRPQIEPGLL
jgi:DNA-binding transcriptional LysR family regulator